MNDNITPTPTSATAALFTLRSDADASTVAAHLYPLTKQSQNIIWRLEELTCSLDNIRANANDIAWLLDTLSELNRQQIACSEFLDNSSLFVGAQS